MRAKIIGTTLPVLEVGLDAGETVIGAPDQLSWMSGDMQLTTSAMGGGGGGGLFGLVSRAVSGAGLFMTEFHAARGPGNVAFAAKMPGNIVEIEVRPGAGYLVHRHGFVCGTPGIEIASAFQQTLGGAVFGGEGFILQKLSGSAQAWIELGGELVTYDLQPGQVILAHPGHVGMFEESVSFEITTMRGVKNALFGGDGLFLARLSGPGKVWLQTLTAPGLAHTLSHYLPQAREH
ncbi:AIM24 family protein [Ancylobacter sp. A5.8]|uniref:AIM24 family protein n=1 Tax=Ancylobacter gelatini TaxID=2919920 RepID=UPI001F4DBC95|nr:AIM24 family protein [Ancylobacter gelatini]MCJ8143455.1 AIM24 family protein [Ancylobacter gelatini]